MRSCQLETPQKDVANVQAAIDGAKDGDTILLKAGTFNFGDWKTNPIPGGKVMISKGVTVKGDGVGCRRQPQDHHPGLAAIA